MLDTPDFQGTDAQLVRDEMLELIGALKNEFRE